MLFIVHNYTTSYLFDMTNVKVYTIIGFGRSYASLTSKEESKMDLGTRNKVTLSKADLQDFTEVLDKCQGNVYLVTDEGDKINMKSQLCRMVGILQIIEGGKFSGGRLECENPDDVALLFRFNLYGKSE